MLSWTQKVTVKLVSLDYDSQFEFKADLNSFKNPWAAKWEGSP